VEWNVPFMAYPFGVLLSYIHIINLIIATGRNTDLLQARQIAPVILLVGSSSPMAGSGTQAKVDSLPNEDEGIMNTRPSIAWFWFYPCPALNKGPGINTSLL